MTYERMNKDIVGILRISDDPSKLYAADRIEELEKAVAYLQAEIGMIDKTWGNWRVAGQQCSYYITRDAGDFSQILLRNGDIADLDDVNDRKFGYGKKFDAEVALEKYRVYIREGIK